MKNNAKAKKNNNNVKTTTAFPKIRMVNISWFWTEVLMTDA